MKNLNELLTIITLFTLCYFTIKALIFALFGSHEKIPGYNRLELLRNYCDNEEE